MSENTWVAITPLNLLLALSLVAMMVTSHSSENFSAFLVLLLSLCLDPSAAVLIDVASTNVTNGVFDYVIAGCGISGLVLAARLSEDPDTTVVCLEAGTL